MDPLRIVVRVVFAYVVLLVLIRICGKSTVKQSNPFEFTVALIIGDIIDDLLWAEVAASQFVVAAGMLVVTHLAFDLARYRAGLGTMFEPFRRVRLR